jgi:hypothetical protein
MDRFETHKHGRLRAFTNEHDIEPVYTPNAYASWLNAIESYYTISRS